jgi:hypothetical protein
VILCVIFCFDMLTHTHSNMPLKKQIKNTTQGPAFCNLSLAATTHHD